MRAKRRLTRKWQAAVSKSRRAYCQPLRPPSILNLLEGLRGHAVPLPDDPVGIFGADALRTLWMICSLVNRFLGRYLTSIHGPKPGVLHSRPGPKPGGQIGPQQSQRHPALSPGLGKNYGFIEKSALRVRVCGDYRPRWVPENGTDACEFLVVAKRSI